MRENEYRSAMLNRDLQWRYRGGSLAPLGNDHSSRLQHELLLAKDGTGKQMVMAVAGEIWKLEAALTRNGAFHGLEQLNIRAPAEYSDSACFSSNSAMTMRQRLL